MNSTPRRYLGMKALTHLKVFVTETIPAWMMHCILLAVWLVLHVPAIFYGTFQLPFHTSYIGDEQSAVTGALQILQTQNPLAIYNLESLYYGPLFALIAIAPVLFDVFTHAVQTGAVSVGLYKNHLLYDWGGIVANSRVVALIVGYLGLLAVYKLLSTRTINPGTIKLPIFIGVGLLATNFYYFAYSGFFKHWIFILVPLLWQLYVLVLMYEDRTKLRKYFVIQAFLTVAAFGVSYLSLLSQIFLLPLFIKMIREKDLSLWYGFLSYAGTLIPLGALLVAWHPMQFFRYLQLFTGNVLGGEANQYSVAVDTDPYAFQYFFKLIVTNHLLIILVGIGVLYLYLKRKERSLVPFLSAYALFGGLYFVIVVAQSNHVSWYSLPAILAILLSVSILVTRLWPLFTKNQKQVVVSLLGLNVAFHVISIFFWSQMMLHGPVERVNVQEILALQTGNPTETVTVVSDRLLGWPHTKESYQAFAEQNNMTTRSLFSALAESNPPAVPLLSVSYVASDSDVIELQASKYTVVCKDPKVGGEREDGNYEEVFLYRLWTADYYWQYACNPISE